MAIGPHLYAESSVRYIVPLYEVHSVARETTACRDYHHVNSRRLPQAHLVFQRAHVCGRDAAFGEVPALDNDPTPNRPT